MNTPVKIPVKTVFVTGANGFVGKHLVRRLHDDGVRVVAIGREPQASPEFNGLIDRYIVCDLADQSAVDALPLDEADSLISLAGLAQVGASFNDPEKYKQINVSVLTTVCQAVLNKKLAVRIIAVSTGAVYDSAQPMPLTEHSRLITDGSPYALSKILMEQAVERFRAQDVDCLIVRPFNHIGPGQEAGFLIPDLYQRMVSALASGEPLKIGNLATKRDYTDVRDVVKAYSLLALAAAGELHSPVYNICSGRTRSGQEILAEIRKNLPGSDSLQTIIDKDLARPNDPMELVGSPELVRQDTGWQPDIPFPQTIADFVRSRQTIP